MAATVMILAIVGCGILLVRLSSFLMLVFAAVVLAVVFSAIAQTLCSLLPIKRGLALSLAVILLLGTSTGALVLFGTQLTNEFDTIRQSLPNGVEQLQAFLDRMGSAKRPTAFLKIGKTACRASHPRSALMSWRSVAV